jgi:hypothetical protein
LVSFPSVLSHSRRLSNYRWNEREKYKAALKTTDVMHPELQIYDRKIYKAQEVMEADFQCRLKTLGVPFFGVPANKIVKTDEEAVDGKITKKKLKELQEKMYQYLQDMYID